MPTFSYRTWDPASGREQSDRIEAASMAEAMANLRKAGRLPTTIKEERTNKPRPRPAASATAKPRSPWFGGGVRASQLTLFTRQFATLQDAGLPIVRSLHILMDLQPPGSFRRTLQTVADQVQEGAMLSEAMARHPRVWDAMATNLVRAGEVAGALETILRRLAEFREKAQKLKRKVIGALVYPAAVMTFAVLILTFIMIFIVPKFETIFREIGIELPGMTVVLIEASRFMASPIGIAVLIGTFLSCGLALLVRRHTRWGAALVDRATLRLPVVGNVIRKLSIARFTRTLSTLMTSGVGFLEALEIVRAATPNHVVRKALVEVRAAVKEGEPMSSPLQRCRVFDALVVNMVQVGEETGELDRMLAKIADTYEEESDAAIAAMLSLMEPVLVVFMGLAVGFIVIALFLPLLKILNDLPK